MIINITEKERQRLLSDSSGKIMWNQRPDGLNKLPENMVAKIGGIEIHCAEKYNA